MNIADYSVLAQSQWQPVLAALPHWLNAASGSSDNLDELTDKLTNKLDTNKLDTHFSALSQHGDAPAWLAALQQLPALPGVQLAHEIDLQDGLKIGESLSDPALIDQLTECLMSLHPWRKGPIEIHGVKIDTEWRSDWKWSRVAPHLSSLEGRRVLDVGCGNGYYGWRMLGAGADLVIGVDPTLVFLMQHLAVSKYLNGANYVVPLRLEELPPGESEFDTVFSMGVLYHRRNAAEHLADLHSRLRPGGELVLETLIAQDTPLFRVGRYARMRNVWDIPTPQLCVQWLEAAGFQQIEIADLSVTTTAEQRTTHWMQFESLAQCLNPEDSSLTVEGYPAPCRAVFISKK